jgi:hypothetical protein
MTNKALHRLRTIGRQPTEAEYVCFRCEESAPLPDEWMHQQHPLDAGRMMNRARKFLLDHQHCIQLDDDCYVHVDAMEPTE